MKLSRLKSARKACGMTQGEVAKKLGVSQAAYSGYESGSIRVSAESISQLAQLFDVPVDYQ